MSFEQFLLLKAEVEGAERDLSAWLRTARERKMDPLDALEGAVVRLQTLDRLGREFVRVMQARAPAPPGCGGQEPQQSVGNESR